jgi:class 3 adenylate cyclase
LERKLTAILCADIFGYSRLMGEDEEATLRTLSSHRKLIYSLIEQHHGRFVNSAGDSVLAEFRQRGQLGPMRRRDPDWEQHLKPNRCRQLRQKGAAATLDH